MAKVTRNEYVWRQLDRGHTLYRITDSGLIIRYTRTRDGVLRCVIHSDGNSHASTISMATAIAQLTRNFKQIN